MGVLKDLRPGRFDAEGIGDRKLVEHRRHRTQERRRKRIFVVRGERRDETDLHDRAIAVQGVFPRSSTRQDFYNQSVYGRKWLGIPGLHKSRTSPPARLTVRC